MSGQYIYAVARIRRKELDLLNQDFMEQLLSASDEEHCLRLLNERGWGLTGQSAEEILEEENKKTWELMQELVGDLSVFNVFRYETDFHNLKAAIKENCVAGTHPGIYRAGGTLEGPWLEKIIAERDFGKLPQYMQDAAGEALEVLLKTRDSQLCDLIVDKAALEAIYAAGKSSKSEILSLYGELTVAAADIKIAIRGAAMKKNRDFFDRSLAACSSLDVRRLSVCAAEGTEKLIGYLQNTSYAGCIEEIRRSPAALERWCDNLLIRRIRPQKSNPFGIDPLAAYVLARQAEIKTVRIILTGKRNDFPEEGIRGRIRETYV